MYLQKELCIILHITIHADYYRKSISVLFTFGKTLSFICLGSFCFYCSRIYNQELIFQLPLFVKYTLKCNVNLVAALVQATLVFCYQYNTLLNDSLFNWNHTISYFINVFRMNMIENSELLSSLWKLSQLVQKYI